MLDRRNKLPASGTHGAVSKRAGSRREKAILVALPLLAIALGIGVVEVFLRLLYPAPLYGFEYVQPQEIFFQYDTELGWSGRANASAQFARLDFDVHVTHDENGFRNRTPPFVPGKRNFLMIGDSFGWGWGVEDDEVHTEILSRSDDLNVYNLSGPGYGTDQAYLTLKRFLAENDFPYDGVVLLFYQNDFADNSDFSRYSYPKPMFALEEDELSLTNVPVPDRRRNQFDPEREIKRSPTRFFHRSHAYNLLRDRVGQIQASITGERVIAPTDPSPEDVSVTLALLRAVASLCAERSMSFDVVILRTMNTDWTLPGWPKLFDFLAEEGIDHTIFRSRRLPRTDLWQDRHYTRSGNRQIARHLRAVLQAPD